MVSRLLLAYFTYGRCPGLEMSVRAVLQLVPLSVEVDMVGLKFPPRQNR